MQWVLMDRLLTSCIVSNMGAFASSIVCRGLFENTLNRSSTCSGGKKIPQATHWVATHLLLFLSDFSQHLIGCGDGPSKNLLENEK